MEEIGCKKCVFNLFQSLEHMHIFLPTKTVNFGLISTILNFNAANKLNMQENTSNFLFQDFCCKSAHTLESIQCSTDNRFKIKSDDMKNQEVHLFSWKIQMRAIQKSRTDQERAMAYDCYIQVNAKPGSPILNKLFHTKISFNYFCIIIEKSIASM